MTKTFNIFGTEWEVQYTDKIEGENFSFGTTDAVNKIVLIATKNSEGADLGERELKLTLIHEMMHAIMCEGQYHDYSDDEPFVEWMAKCLISLYEQDFKL